MALLLQLTKGWRRSFVPPTMWSMCFGFALTTSSVVWVTTKKKLFGSASSTQHMTGEDRYQSLEGGGVGARRHRVPIATEGGHFSTSHAFNNCNTPNPRSHFCVPSNLDTHPTTKFLKTVQRNPTTFMVNHKNKWESAGLMNGYYVGGIAIPYPRFGVIINIVSKEDISYRIIIGDIPHCTCLDFTKYHLKFWKEREMGAMQTSLLCV